MKGLVGSQLGRQVGRIDKPVESWVDIYLTGSSECEGGCSLCETRLDVALVGLRNRALESRGISESFASTNALPPCLLGQRRSIFFFNVSLLKTSDLI
jgi:hypothetical protein